VNKKLLISTNIKLISRTSNVHFNGGKNMKLHFFGIGFLAHQILGIVESQIKTKRIVSIIGIIHSHLQLDNSSKLIFVNKNWPMILGLVASSPSSLVEFIKIDTYFKNELKEFEGVRKSFRKG
jgi:hypothetical protein